MDPSLTNRGDLLRLYVATFRLRVGVGTRPSFDACVRKQAPAVRYLGQFPVAPGSTWGHTSPPSRHGPVLTKSPQPPAAAASTAATDHPRTASPGRAASPSSRPAPRVRDGARASRPARRVRHAATPFDDRRLGGDAARRPGRLACPKARRQVRRRPLFAASPRCSAPRPRPKMPLRHRCIPSAPGSRSRLRSAPCRSSAGNSAQA